MPKGTTSGKPVGRPKGLAKTGGRVAGTPNKDNTLKVLLHQHSQKYFEPTIPLGDVDIPDEKAKARFIMMHEGEEKVSQYDVDLYCMKATDRVNAELSMLKYHTPQMQAVSADMTVKEANTTITTRLTRIVNGEDLSADEF